MVFSDENDSVYHDDEYKEEHRDDYWELIQGDIEYANTCHQAIRNKLFMNNRCVGEIVNELLSMIENSR